MAIPIDIVFNVVKFVPLEIGEIGPYSHDKNKNKILAASQTVATLQIAPKICQDQPPTFGSHCSRFHPNRFTFVGVIAKRVNTVCWTRRVFLIFARSD